MIQNQKGSIQENELKSKLSEWYKKEHKYENPNSTKSKKQIFQYATKDTEIRLDLIQIAQNMKQWIGEVYGIADHLDLLDDTFAQLDKTDNQTFSKAELEKIIKETIEIK